MSEVVDFFFSPYSTAQERRLQAALENGLAHVSRIEPRHPGPDEPVTLLFTTNAHQPIDFVAVYYTLDGTEPTGERGKANNGLVISAKRDTPDGADSTQATQQWQAVIPAQSEDTLVRYRADAWSKQDVQAHWYADSIDPVTNAPKNGRIFAYHVDRRKPPTWWQDTIVYQIFVDRFNAAHDEAPLLTHDQQEITGFFGGTLKGILEKLDYIQELRVNCIWLSPIFESPTHHGYNASDYHIVAKRYGTNETLRQLINEVHTRGMRVMLDLAANHTSNEHTAFVAALHDPRNPAREWYLFDDDSSHGYRSYALVEDMPELLTDNPAVQRYLFDVALYWLGDLGADALRLDYMPGPSHAFWTLFQQEVKTHFPNALTIGEITGPLSEIASYAGRVDAFMDFPLAHMLRNVFALRTAPLADLLTYISERRALLPKDMGRATLLDNHDMHRFLWLADNDKARLRLAATCHLTLDGTPIIYYGTEVGLSQYDDAHKENAYARAPMLWGEQQDIQLLAYYRRLVALRSQFAALRSGTMHILPTQALLPNTEGVQSQIGAYIRRLQDQIVIIVLNNSQSEVKMNVTVGDYVPNDSPLSDYLTNRAQVPVMNGVIELALPALEAIILAV